SAEPFDMRILCNIDVEGDLMGAKIGDAVVLKVIDWPRHKVPMFSSAMFLYFSFVIPAGVSIYWIFSSVFGILQELLLRIFFNPEKEKEKIEEEILEARRLRKEQEKQRREKRKTVKGDKYVEEVIEDKAEAEKVRQRLERARALDREKYGE
ncbi:MAG: hypothetical protein IKI92_07005, partial [Anaerotignum sp.]|nr:hypothetical protein [Anaerotignum sp.]